MFAVCSLLKRCGVFSEWKMTFEALSRKRPVIGKRWISEQVDLRIGKVVNGNPTSLTISLVAPRICDFASLTQSVAPWVQMQLFETCDLLLQEQTSFPEFCVTRLLQGNKRHHLKKISSTVRVNRAFHDKIIDLNLLDAKIWVGVLNHDIVVCQSLTDGGNSELLTRRWVRYSFLGEGSGKRSELPRWFTDLCPEAVFEDNPDLYILFGMECHDEQPLNVFKFFDQVKVYDLDANGLAAFSSYVRFCYDAALSQSSSKKVPLFFKTIKSYFLGDSVYGNQLEVNHWKNSAGEDVFKVINKSSGQDVFMAFMNFYDDCLAINIFEDFATTFMPAKEKSGRLAVQVHRDGRAQITGNELAFSQLVDFCGPTGNLNIWQVADVFGWRRHVTVWYTTNFERLHGNSLIFILVSNLDFTKDFYKLVRRGRLTNMTSDTKIVNVGRSSIDVMTTAKVDDLDVVSCSERIVFVDPVTRKPTAVVGQMLADCFGHRKCTSLPAYQRAVDVPDETWVTEIRVNPSCIDSNDHVTHYVYIRACMETAYQAMQDGKFDRVYLESFAVRKMSALFVGEALLGDILKVHGWVSSVDKDEFCFVIKKSERPIFYATIQFYKSLEGPKKITSNM